MCYYFKSFFKKPNSAYLAVFFIAAGLFIHSCKQKPSEAEAIPDLADSLKGTFWDYNLPLEERIDDLLSKMTLEEKVSQMRHESAAIERLGIPAYNWWSEALHGVARAGRATVFPQAIGLAATFDDELIGKVATAISDEARAKFKAAQKIGNKGQYMGLTFWSPNVNLFRDPRWGRGHETYGEDPYLSGKIGIAFVKGLQGDNPSYLKAAACAKHYVVHSGPEGLRHEFNAVPSKKDFFETYLPAFKALVTEADVEIVMCAYNRTYDLPCCGSKYLLTDILREKWGFKGHIVSDCWAINDFHAHHKVVDSEAESAAMALKAGVDVNCGNTYRYLTEAVKQGLIGEEEIDKQLRNLVRTRFKLGLFDPVELNPYNKIPIEKLGAKEHVDLAREVAGKSIVLLKNKNNVLPLKKDLKSIAILGPHGNDAQVMYGNYYGQSANVITVAEGVTAKVHPGTKVEFSQGFLLDRPNENPIDWTTSAANNEDAVIVIAGISNLLEGEEGESILSQHKGDRNEIKLPKSQVDYLKRLRKAGDKPIILVLTGGSPVSIAEVEDLADAVLFVWYPGEQGGNAIADVIFGDVNPSGRLPLTFPKSIEQLPAYEDYSMVGRTYRYMQKEPLYTFGFGLSYSTFAYNDLTTDKKNYRANEKVMVKVKVKNTGKLEGEEVVQLYVSDLKASTRTPIASMKGFKRVSLKPGQEKEVSFELNPSDFELVLESGEVTIEPGSFKISIGGASPSQRSLDLGAPAMVSKEIEIE